MSAEARRAEVYHLKGTGIELTYRRSDGKLDLTGDEHLLTQDGLDVVATAEPELGLIITATLLESSRDGTRVTLMLLLPEVTWPPETTQDAQEVTGVAIVTRSFENRVGGPPPVLQRYDEARRLEGTALPA